MSKKLIFATTNEGKMKEIRMILADLGMEILSLKGIVKEFYLLLAFILMAQILKVIHKVSQFH